MMSQSQPDILLIVLDTVRRDRLSAYNPALNTSPHLDEFAARATLFERAVAPAQWTIPAHASMFTGVYPTTHQVTQADGQLSGSYPTLAEILQEGGYHTAGFCNNPLVGVLENGLQRGFDAFYNYAGAAPERPLSRRVNGTARHLSQAWGRFARTVSNHFAHSDWMFQVALHPRVTPVWTRWANYKGHTGNSVDDLMAYVSRHREDGREQPLFAFLNLMGAHLPYHPPHEMLKRHAPEVASDRDAQRFIQRFNADATRWASPVEHPPSTWERQVIEAYYDAEIAQQDEHLGRLLRGLEQSGALEDTVVIIVADHGEGHGDHNFFGHSFVVYQELVHVPLVIYAPARFPVGARIRTNVSTRRIFHTVLDAAGMVPPLDEADPNADVDGLSLARAVNGRVDSEGDTAFAEAIPPGTFLRLIERRQPEMIERLRLDRVRRGVYHGEHKLAVVDDQVEGLFDLADDPAELNNIALTRVPLAESLRGKLDAFVDFAEYYRVGGAAFSGVSAEVADHLRALGYFE